MGKNRSWAIRIDSEQAIGYGIVKAELGNFKNGRKPRLDSGDKVLLYTKEKKHMQFLAIGELKDFFGEDTIGDTVSYMATISVDNIFERPRDLSDYAFSMERVYRIFKPENHFRRRYVGLSEDDISTLEDETIHGPRTAIALLASALPIAVRFELLANYFHQSKQDLRSYDHVKFFDYMYQFISEKYLSMSRYVIESDKYQNYLSKDWIIDGVEIEGSVGPPRAVENRVTVNYALNAIAGSAQKMVDFYSDGDNSALKELVKRMPWPIERRTLFQFDMDELVQLVDLQNDIIG